jgi:hypothetical protein
MLHQHMCAQLKPAARGLTEYEMERPTLRSDTVAAGTQGHHYAAEPSVLAA